MKKDILEENIKKRWKKLAGIKEGRYSRRHLDGSPKAWDEVDDAPPAKPQTLSPQTATSADIYRTKAQEAVASVLKNMNVTDEWEKDFLDKLGRVYLPPKFEEQGLLVPEIEGEAKRKAEKFIGQYRDFMKEKGVPNYRTAVSSMNYQQQLEFEKPLYDMMKNIAAEPAELSLPAQQEPEPETEPEFTMAGDIDYSPEQLKQKIRQQKELDRKGMFGAFGKAGFRGVAEGNNKK